MMHNRNAIMHNPSFKMHISTTYSGSNTHTIPAFHMFIITHWHQYINCRDEVTSSTYLSMKNSPATNYVVAMFHPTIGQCAHQSLSNAATLELGMIPPRIRVNAGLHIARGHNRQPTQLGFLGHQQIGQASTVRRPTTAYTQPNNPFTALWRR